MEYKCSYLGSTKKEFFNSSRFRYLNEISGFYDQKNGKELEIKLGIKQSNENEQNSEEKEKFLDKNKINYIVKFKLDEKSKEITFLFDDSLSHDINSNKLMKVAIDWWSNENIDYSEKFLLYYDYYKNKLFFY